MSELVWPVRLGPDGQYLTIESGSPGEIQQSVGLLLATRGPDGTGRPGERQDSPEYGTDDPTLQGVDAAALIADAQRWEPRASLQVIVGAVDAVIRTQTSEIAVSSRPTTEGGAP